MRERRWAWAADRWTLEEAAQLLRRFGLEDTLKLAETSSYHFANESRALQAHAEALELAQQIVIDQQEGE